MVNLKRIYAGANTQNVLLVASYPVTIIETEDMGTIVSCYSSLQPPESQAKVYSYCNSPAYLTSGRFSRAYEQDVADLLQSEMRQTTPTIGQENISAVIYPNPAKDNITISYALSRIASVKISIFTMEGKLIKHLINTANHDAGKFARQYDLSKLASGLYLVLIQTNNRSFYKKLMIAK